MAKIYLVPQSLSPDTLAAVLPGSVAKVVAGLRVFIVEEEASAQRFLKKLIVGFPIAECEFLVYNEHTPVSAIADILTQLKGRDSAIISEAGCPCVADPGSEIVRLAHEQGIEIVPLVGPSSILLALMASGLNGQNFAFNGYLPKERDARIRRIRDLEHRSRVESQTQIFMETPYRNQHLFDDLLATLAPETLLCVAVALTSAEQTIKTLAVKEWSKTNTELKKQSVVFLIQKRS